MRAALLPLLMALTLPEPALPASGAWSRWIPPDSPWLSWSGRVLFEGGAAHFDWSGCSVRAEFEGTALLAYLDPRDNNFNLFVDGSLLAILGPKPRDPGAKGYALWAEPAPGSDGKAWIFSKLPAGRHRVELTKRTGANFGEASFRGLRFDAAAKPIQPPPPPARRLEFVGDSLTNAYGCEGPGKACGELRPYENGWKSWAARAARELGADAQVLAISGFGVVRNYGDKNPRSLQPLPHFYPRTLQNREFPAWDRSRYRPDAVIINLGTNDHSTEPNPPAHDFLQGYMALIRQALEGRKGVPLFLGSVTGRPVQEERMRAVAGQAKASGIDVELLVLEGAPDDELGCDWHPLESVHERWSRVLVQALRRKLSW